MAAESSSERAEQGGEPLIRAANLCYAFGEGDARKRVLFDIDLTVAPGEFAIMTGPSGSGKTTLLSLIGTLRSPQEGMLRVMGRDLRHGAPDVTTTLGERYGAQRSPWPPNGSS